MAPTVTLEWLRRARSPALAGAAFLYVWWVVDPSLQFEATPYYPAFLRGADFAAPFLNHPGGPVAYVAAWLSQYFHYGWLGALIITVMLAGTCRATGRILTALSSRPPGWLALAPGTLLLVVLNQFDYSLASLAATCLAAVAAASYASLRSRAPGMRAAAFLGLALLVYCHAFASNAPERMTLGLRSAVHGNATLLAGPKGVQKIGHIWGYNSWHPGGEAIAYSLNKVRQFFHDAGQEVRDVVDLDSDLLIYRVDSGKVETVPGIADPDRLETYPTWSPDGKYLYFCSAPILWKDRNQVPPDGYRQVRYDLRRISYDAGMGRSGKPETVLSAAETGLSILLPRISPDGRWLLFCMCTGASPSISRPATCTSWTSPVASTGGWTSTATSPNPGTRGPATAAGSPSAASAATAC